MLGVIVLLKVEPSLQSEVTGVHWNRFSSRMSLYVPAAATSPQHDATSSGTFRQTPGWLPCVFYRGVASVCRARPDWGIAAGMVVLLEGSLSIKKPLSVESNRQVLGHLSD